MDIVKVFIALLVLVNPVGAMPVFVSLTPNASDEERRHIAQTTCKAIAIIIMIFALLGDSLIRFLGISLGSFQVGGGLLVLLISLSMMNAKPETTKTNPQEQDEAEIKPNIAVVPLAMPLMTGPGTIGTVIIYAGTAKTWMDTGALILCGCAIALLSYVVLRTAAPFSRILGKTGINIVNRVMGMLLAALSIEIMADGLIRLFPKLVN